MKKTNNDVAVERVDEVAIGLRRDPKTGEWTVNCYDLADGKIVKAKEAVPATKGWHNVISEAKIKFVMELSVDALEKKGLIGESK